MQVHTKRLLTTIPTCGRQGSTNTNTKLTYNLFTPGPSVRLVENLAEDQLPLLGPRGGTGASPSWSSIGRSSSWCAAPEPFCCPSASR